MKQITQFMCSEMLIVLSGGLGSLGRGGFFGELKSLCFPKTEEEIPFISILSHLFILKNLDPDPDSPKSLGPDSIYCRYVTVSISVPVP